MSQIQLDMFEVQLGAGMLLQFRDEEASTVTVLADAGVHAARYAQNHVHKKLNNTLPDPKRIDLMIGTHYDKDHLYGLIPIIQDTSIDIGEAWLPPVANDTQSHAYEDSANDTHMLANQFAKDDNRASLNAYLRAKADFCERMKQLQMATMNQERYELSEVPEQLSEEYFRAHVKEANILLDAESYDHTDDLSESPTLPKSDFQLPSIGSDYWRVRGELRYLYEDFEYRHWLSHQDKDLAHRHACSFAFLRRSAAKDAINATYLEQVVRALVKRKIPIQCYKIQDGVPGRFYWDATQRRFIPGQVQTSGPVLTLLGPSQGLVQKHWKRLPVGGYFATSMLSLIALKPITASNQLSYVIRFEYANQGVLVSGDAGFVDFTIGRSRKYHPNLLNTLLPLHVVQVAHHGGNNAHFYRALLKAGYGKSETKPFLLLSHAVDDAKRPSTEFGQFIQQIRHNDTDIKLLFTSRPNRNKVQNFLPLIHPVVGYPVSANVGDVQMKYTPVHGWQVLKHAIAP